MTIFHTYSIVALDRKANQIGVAVQSHWFAVGALCPWIEPGIGAIATQSIVEVSYGPKGLALLREGKSAQQALFELLKADDRKELRQVAMVDAHGNVAAHTGKRCIAEAGHQIGNSFSVQANMMLNATVWPAMASAFKNTRGNLANRLLATLQAAQSAGGDIRGKQSASMLVSENIKDNTPWKHTLIDLRVDDHSDPIAELKRLLDIQNAYDLMNTGDDLLSKNKYEAARNKYEQAAKLAPDIEELPFWQAVALADIGKVDEALPIFEQIFKKNRNWALLVQRLPASGLLTNNPQIMHKILSVKK
ncbi:MAG: DUF1028 domain-containing protein [Anaerolineaceae bacterium]|nr:DUF1028 domain-containing protein [Anaerolineaceae bacterium]